MSKYENYDEACRFYDNQRCAVGADVMVAMLQLYSGKQLKDLKILDAGCGTGNYAKAFIEMGASQLSILDSSSGMLEKAKCKLNDYIEKDMIGDIVEAKMPPIPFPAHSFDVVMFNVVLNHLDKDDPSFPNCVTTLKEAERILRPGGLIIVSAMLETVATRVLWFTQLNKDLTKRFVEAVVPSIDQYKKIFDEAGIACLQKLNILGSDVYKDYYNLDGPLLETWRRTSSYWSFATNDEVEVAVEKIKDLKSKEKYEEWVKEHDHSEDTGILTIFICKPF